MTLSAQSHDAGGAVNARVVLLVTSIASFLSPFSLSSVNVALPSIASDLALDAVALSWMATAGVIATAVCQIPFGKLSDIYGRKKMFLYGVASFSCISLLGGLATSGTMLLVLRILQGIAIAMIFSTQAALLTSAYPPKDRGRALGISIAAIYGGQAVGPFIGGLMTQQIGWRSIFFLIPVMGIPITALILWKMRVEWADARGQKFDVIGSVISGLAMVAALTGLSLLPSPVGFALLVVGAICLIGFIRWEDRVDNPVLELDLFRHNLMFTLSNLTCLIHYSAAFSVTFLMSLFLQYVKGFDPTTAGGFLLIQPAIMFVFSPVAGWLSDRVEPRYVVSAGLALTTTGLAIIASFSDTVGPEMVVLALAIIGVGAGLFSSPNTSATLGCVDRSYLGVASGTSSAMRGIGQSLSMGITTLVITAYVGGVQITPAYHAPFVSAFRLALLIFAFLCGIGVFASLARGNLYAASADR